MSKGSLPDLGKVIASNKKLEPENAEDLNQQEITETQKQEPKATRMYTEAEVMELLNAHKTELGEMDDAVTKKVEDAVSRAMSMVNAIHPKLSTNAIMQEVVSSGESSSQAIKKLEKLFKEKGVGSKAMTFKTKVGMYKLLTIKNRATITIDGEVIQMLATKSSTSPFRIKQPQDLAMWAPKISPIFFMSNGDRGVIEVPPSYPCLQAYLLAYPKYGSLYELEDKEADAKLIKSSISETKELEKILDEVDGTDKARIMAVGVVGASQAIHLTNDEIYIALRDRLMLNKNAYKQETSDASNEYEFAIMKGSVKGLIENSGIGMSYKGSVIHSNSSLVSPMISFAEWSTSNRELYNDLMLKLDKIKTS